MLSDYFTDMERVEIYAMVAFFIFFVFFIVVTIHTIRLNKRKAQELGNIPLEDGATEQQSDFKTK